MRVQPGEFFKDTLIHEYIAGGGRQIEARISQLYRLPDAVEKQIVRHADFGARPFFVGAESTLEVAGAAGLHVENGIPGRNELVLERAIDHDLEPNERISDYRRQNPQAQVAPPVGTRG